MSIEIDWQTLLNDNGEFTNKVRSFLDEQLSGLQVAPFVKDLAVTSFDLGSVAPEITIKHIGDPFYEFYDLDESDNDNEDGDCAIDETEPHVSTTISATASAPDATTEALFDLPPEVAEEPEELQSRRTSRLLDPQEGSSERHEIDGYLRYFQSSLRPGLLATRSQLYSPFGTRAHNSSTSLASKNPKNPLNGGLGSVPSKSKLTQEAVTDAAESVPAPPVPPAVGAPKSKVKGYENDVQFFLEISYSGDMTMGLVATLLLNYPSPNFISLPLKLTITDLSIHVLAVLAIIKDKMLFSVICDVDGEAPGSIQRDKIDIIKNVRIDTEIGAQDSNGSILRNVGKVETFLLEKVRSIIRDEVAWPGWITFEI